MARNGWLLMLPAPLLAAAFFAPAILPLLDPGAADPALVDWNAFNAPIPDDPRPRLLLRFVQVSDAHVLDDDAPPPVREWYLDKISPPFEQSQRPQEEYTDEMLDAMVAAIRAEHDRAPIDFVINTGDNIDNSLENELIRYIDVWEGAATYTPRFGNLGLVPDGQSTGIDDMAHDQALLPTGLPEGLRPQGLHEDLPWYSVFGNHDALIQGNVPVFSPFRPSGLLVSGRHFLNQREYIALHFPTNPCSKGWDPKAADHGHGFGWAEIHGGRLCDDDPGNDGYYAFDAGPFRLVVLDTVNDDWAASNGYLSPLAGGTPVTRGADRLGGYAEGTVDAAQMAWLGRELEENRARPVLLFAHHTANSFYVPDPVPEAAGFATRTSFNDFVSAHGNVVAFIGGHTHRHRIEAKTGSGPHGYWNVETSSIIDAPSESRLIEAWSVGGGVGYLAIRPIGHGFRLGHDLQETDPQHDGKVAAGEARDRSVRLWFRVADDVRLEP